MISGLGEIASYQATANYSTIEDCAWILNYAAIHTDATVRYKYSDIILRVHSAA